ncbi:MAG: RusA family crossover junction endodeoxyribonuclease [Thermodesulfobacteriota bacterium]
MKSNEFIILGNPIAQGRPRFARRGNFVVTYDPEKSKEWKNEIIRQAVAQKAEVLEGALRVELMFRMKRPKSLPKKVKYHIKKPDLDNLAKAVLDALSGICYNDDSQIVSMGLFKSYVVDGQAPCVDIEIEEV